MEKILTQEQRLQRRALGLPLDGFTVVDALPPEEPRSPEPIPRLEQLRQRLACGLLTETEAAELRKLNEPAEREGTRTWQFSQLTHRLAAGLIERGEYVKERNRLTEQLERGENSSLLFESQGPAERKKRLWEQHRAGKLSMNECLTRCAEITVAEEKSRRATLRRERQLLREHARTRFQIVQRKDGPFKIRGVLSRADEVNGNGRVYPLKIWQREIEKLQPALREKRVLGAADHPADGNSKIEDCAILWERIFLDVDGKTTIGEGTILNTQKGRDLRALVEAGAMVDISSRAWGSLAKTEWKGKIAEVAQDALELVTFDAVLGGSVRNAHLSAA